MADGTHIEWTDATWNPVTGCSVVSPGCTNCYAMRLAGTRLKHTESRQGLTDDTKAGPVWNGQVRFNEAWLDQPLRWRRPRRIFVCAHGDLFHEAVPDEWIDRVFAVMALAPQHTFQVLTKRSARMRDYLTAADCAEHIGFAEQTLPEDIEHITGSYAGPVHRRLPLPNIWLGVSAEDQQRADERIPDLLATPAAKHFISAEPLLGPIDARQYLVQQMIGPELRVGACLDWVIAGGESGRDARHCDPAWVRLLRDQCEAACVAFFFKQWGHFYPAEMTRTGECGEVYRRYADGIERWSIEEFSLGLAAGAAPVEYESVGKRAAGRLLDGREWSEFP